MQIIQCDSCSKRYKVKENQTGAATSKYKCPSCFHIIGVVNSNHTRDPSQLQSAEKRLLSHNPVDDRAVHRQNPGPTENSADNLDLDAEGSAERSLSLRTKFNLTTGAVLICAMVLIYFWANSRMQREAEDQILDKAQLLLTTMEASRDFTKKVVKPALYKALPGRFITEGMSSSFGARNIFERISKVYPQYYFKHAAPYPRNPINQADLFEMNIIKKFNNEKKLKEWQGYRSSEGGKKYSIMKPIVATQRCMRCHGDPGAAPKELLEKYGDKNGFGRSVGEVIGTLTISVPASVVMKKAQTNTMAFTGMVALFFGLLIIIANFFFAKVVLRPIKYLADNADDISLGKLDTRIDTSGGDEIAKLAKAFDRMKISMKMAFERLAR
ncbi:MAG: DUF3365 domain-containing protein [Desulfobacteraceae bacterium]|jgi:predicted Zn finger-like uncharacterized protein